MTPDDRFAYDLPGLARGWLRMAPWIAGLWLLAAAPPGPGVREALIAAVLSVFVVVAAARSRGLHAGRGVARVGLERMASHATNLLVFLLILFLAAGLGGTLGTMTAEALGLPELLLAVPITVLATLPILYWFWPVAVIAGVAPDETGRRARQSAWYWRGPGYTSARRLLASFGSGRRTGLILGVGYLWLGLLVAAEQYRGADAFPALAEAASYGVFLPLWVWLATVETDRLIRAVLDGRAAAEAENGSPHGPWPGDEGPGGSHRPGAPVAGA